MWWRQRAVQPPTTSETEAGAYDCDLQCKHCHVNDCLTGQRVIQTHGLFPDTSANSAEPEPCLSNDSYDDFTSQVLQ